MLNFYFILALFLACVLTTVDLSKWLQVKFISTNPTSSIDTRFSVVRPMQASWLWPPSRQHNLCAELVMMFIKNIHLQP